MDDRVLFWTALGAVGTLATLAYMLWRDLMPNPLSLLRRQSKLQGTHSVSAIEKAPIPEVEDFDVVEDEASTVVFNDRVRVAFPGVDGEIEISDPASSVDRLEILLRPPLQTSLPSGGKGDPVWWFRGHSSSPVRSFRRLSDTKCLIGNYEIIPRRLVVFRSPAYWQQFVYLETAPESQTGLYSQSLQSIEQQAQRYGCTQEEYAIFNGHQITRAEYDDGAASIAGAIRDTRGAELRIRYLTRCNMILCAKFNPMNQSRLDGTMRDILDRVLLGRGQVSEIIELVQSLERHSEDQ